jgi:predicted metal-dependent phosphoesterase TrpH
LKIGYARSMICYDLHCHSTCSDGVLAPADVVERAAANGVNVLALTDHDELSGLAEARAAAAASGVEFVDGAELSVTWDNHTLHVVALRIDPEDPTLAGGLAAIRDGRDARARRIADSLAAAGVPDCLAGARKFVTSERLISRTHFARFLVEAGYARNMKAAFKRYLMPGVPGHVPHAWASLPQAVGWIHGAGGQAVLAHPGRYAISPGRMRQLLGEFRDLDGDAIEVLSSSHTAAQCAEYATYARVFGLKASCGSDFHAPGESWVELGDLPPLPVGVDPVWSSW